MKLLYFIRHGETNWNREKKIQGGDQDTELNETGRIQSLMTGKYLCRHQTETSRFDCIISSPLKRAKETATIISEELGFQEEIILDPNLKEVICGEISGKVYRDIVNRTKRHKKKNGSPNFNKIESMLTRIECEQDPIRKAYLNNSDALELALCEIGHESIFETKKRGQFFLDWIASCNFNKIIIVGHSHFFDVLRDLMFNISGGTLDGEYSNRITNCSIMHVVYKNGKFRLITKPNTLHFNIVS